MKAAHGGQVGGERLALPCLKLLDEGLDVGGDYFFRRLPLWLLLVFLLELHLFFLLAARSGVFVSHSAARQKRLNGRQERTTTGTGRSHERQARPVTNLFCGFGAQTAPAKGGPKRLYAEGTAGTGGSGEKARESAYRALNVFGDFKDGGRNLRRSD